MDSNFWTWEGALNCDIVVGRSMNYIYVVKIESAILGEKYGKNLNIFFINALT